jgi:hypothetical protein
VTKPFDNTLIDGTAADWAAFLADVLGIPPGPLADYDPIRDGNLSTTATRTRCSTSPGCSRPSSIWSCSLGRNSACPSG